MAVNHWQGRTDKRSGRAGLWWAFLLLVSSFSSIANAGPSAADRATAEALFDQALKLMEAGNPQQACPKLEESQRLDPGVGTLLYLADCYRSVGRTASAWATFLQASYDAKSEGQSDREQIAREQAAALKPQLSNLVLVVEDKDTPGLTITNDGQELGRALWGSEAPVDPGEHTLVAEAPNKKPWTATILIPEGPASTEIKVPSLEDAPVEAAPATPVEPAAPAQAEAPPAEPVADTGGGSAQTTWGWVAVAAGGGALVGGGLFSMLALSDNGRADDHCRRNDPTLCADRGVELGESAQDKAQLATILSGAGAALAVTGVVLLLTAPDDADTAALHLAPAVGKSSGGLSVYGKF